MASEQPGLRLHPLTGSGQSIRGEDAWGAGCFGAPRGERTHRGVDIVCPPGETVLCPLDGDIVREAEPYDDEPRYSGLLIQGRNAWRGYEVKIFYLRPCPAASAAQARRVAAGQPLGTAEDLGRRYPGMTNHVHLEVRRDGKIIDPTPLLAGLPA